MMKRTPEQNAILDGLIVEELRLVGDWLTAEQITAGIKIRAVKALGFPIDGIDVGARLRSLKSRLPRRVESRTHASGYLAEWKITAEEEQPTVEDLREASRELAEERLERGAN